MEKVLITESSFDDVFALKDALQQALIPVGIDIGLGKIGDVDLTKDGLSKLADIDLDLDSVVNGAMKAFCQVDSDKNLRKCIFKCLERCTFDKVKITKDFFETSENREFYYPIVTECIKVNLKPFMKPLFSKLKGLQGMQKSLSQKSE
jgi:hypothetical protein